MPNVMSRGRSAPSPFLLFFYDSCPFFIENVIFSKESRESLESPVYS